MGINAENDDLAVYFFEKTGEDTSLRAKWLPYTTYTQPKYKIERQSSWTNSLLTVEDGNPPAFIVNLTLLLPGGVAQAAGSASATTSTQGVEPSATESPAATAGKPGPGDLVVLPRPRPNARLEGNAFCIPRSVLLGLEDVKDGPQSSDLDYMALDEGVVVGNVPKVELVGMSCIVLGLVNVSRDDAFTARQHFDRLRKSV